MLQEQLMHERVRTLRADADLARSRAAFRAVRKARRKPVVEIVEAADGGPPRLILIRGPRS